MLRIRPNKRRAKNAIIWIKIIIVFGIVSLVSKYLQYDMLLLLEDKRVTRESWEINVFRDTTIDYIFFLVGIASIITFIQWFHRAYYNLHQHVSNLSYSEGWAAASWFVPILCFYAPYRIMKDLFVETKAQLGDQPEHSIFQLNIWWAIWLSSWVIAIFAGSPDWETGTIDELKKATVGGMISISVGIVLSFITIDLIKRYSKAEALLMESGKSKEATIL